MEVFVGSGKDLDGGADFVQQIQAAQKKAGMYPISGIVVSDIVSSLAVAAIEKAKSFGMSVFADLRLGGVAADVAAQIGSLVSPVKYVTLRPSSPEVYVSARQATQVAGRGVQVLGITVPTSVPKQEWEKKHGSDMISTIQERAKILFGSGCGVVCSGEEAAFVSPLRSTPELRIVGMGIYLPTHEPNYGVPHKENKPHEMFEGRFNTHRRQTSVPEAIDAGCDVLVMTTQVYRQKTELEYVIRKLRNDYDVN